MLAALAACLAGGLLSFAGPCPLHADGSVPSCQGAQRVLLGMDAILGIIALVRIFELDEGERRGLSFCAGLMGALIALTPSLLVNLCTDPTMPCLAALQPFVRCIGGAVAIVGGTDLTKRLLALRT